MRLTNVTSASSLARAKQLGKALRAAGALAAVCLFVIALAGTASAAPLKAGGASAAPGFRAFSHFDGTEGEPSPEAPLITSADAATFTAGTEGSFAVIATGVPAPSVTETGALPAGVSFTGGALAGTPTQSGVFPITIEAQNGVEPAATQSFTLTVDASPAITSAASASFIEESAQSFSVTATGFPAPTVTETGALPAGVTLTGASLSGTPTQSGVFPITIEAQNGVEPAATQSFTLTVDAAPVITSANSATLIEGTAGSFTPVATGFPAPTITETGALPAGVALTAGSLSGTPTQSGVFPITIEAQNGVAPAATQSFTLTVDAAPAITSANTATFVVGTAGSFTPVATGFPAPTVTESGALPTGVSFTGGKLTGTATVTGTFPITLTASNGIGSNAVQSFTLDAYSKPAITSSSKATFTVGAAGTFTPAATGFPAPTISESGALPGGVTFSGGVLSGTPTQGGVFPIMFTAGNGVGSGATQAFTLTVDAPPVITSAKSASFVQGAASSFTVTATGTPAPTYSEWGNLPEGVTLNPTTGVLGGRPVIQGNYEITITAANGIGTPSTQQFTLSVVGLLITTGHSLPTATVGSAYSQQLAATGGVSPYKWKLVGGSLPKGLKLSRTGLISGTPVKPGLLGEGLFALRIQVSDSSKTDPQTVTAAFTIHLTEPAGAVARARTRARSHHTGSTRAA